MKRRSRWLAAFVAVCSVMAWAALGSHGLESETAQISLSARLLPSAELSLGDPHAAAQSNQQAAVSVVKIAPTSVVVVAPANSVVELPFTIKMNGRSARVSIVNHAKGSAPLVSAMPAATDCDWVHASVPVEKARVVASLTGCTPHYAQQGKLHVQSAAMGAEITMTIEPLE